ncbi:MAG: undecaprenyl-diphosphatase, partial [Actinobacteria bacterium]|nr:undecaprenyl-diphosphatase [Actinomycetota bacterium]
AFETAAATFVAFVIGYSVIAWLMKFVQTKSFMPFVIYRIALGIFVIGMLLTGNISS